jgi:hypothetical protein
MLALVSWSGFETRAGERWSFELPLLFSFPACLTIERKKKKEMKTGAIPTWQHSL